MRSGSLSVTGWNRLIILTALSIGEGARCKRRLDPVYWGQRAHGRWCSTRGTLAASAPHPDGFPGIRQSSPSAPHPPQSGRCGDASRSLPVKLEERHHQVIAVHQGRVSQLGVRPCEIYVHYDRVARLTLLVLKSGRRVRLCLRVRHTCGANLIFSPLNVTPVQLPLHVLVLLLQNDVLQRRHYDPKGMVVQQGSENVWSSSQVSSPPLGWGQMIILLHSSSDRTIRLSSFWGGKKAATVSKCTRIMEETRNQMIF